MAASTSWWQLARVCARKIDSKFPKNVEVGNVKQSPLDFLCNNDCAYRPNLDWLFHYTDCNTAIKHIVGGQKCLWINNFENVNDPREGRFEGLAFYGAIKDEEFPSYAAQIKVFLRKRIKVLCFSTSDQRRVVQNTSHPDYVHGHLKPRMWASYRNNHKGVCLVFEKAKLDELISIRFPSADDNYSGMVKYS